MPGSCIVCGRDQITHKFGKASAVTDCKKAITFRPFPKWLVKAILKKDFLLRPSENHRMEHGEVFTSGPAICGTGKELLSDPAPQYSEKTN